mgnify:FL=1|jgi:hypothetical protein|tara:strand:+ start:54 stop:566 length:513 start_codon:yes stop_codon:yes gene_type:complete
MSKTPLTDSIRKQTRRQTNTEFNNLIGTILSDLPSQSPQYTGFFASSWQANTYRPLANEAIRSPWLEIKKQKRQGLKVDPRIEPRYPLDRKFTFGETVFIGNRADYARQALGSPNSRIVPYLAELEKVVDFVFGGSMNQPDVRVAESQVLFKGTEPGRNAPALGSKYKKL